MTITDCLRCDQYKKNNSKKNINSFIFCLLKSKDVIYNRIAQILTKCFFINLFPLSVLHKEFHTYEELKNGTDDYILFYNQIRPHKN